MVRRCCFTFIWSPHCFIFGGLFLSWHVRYLFRCRKTCRRKVSREVWYALHNGHERGLKSRILFFFFFLFVFFFFVFFFFFFFFFFFYDQSKILAGSKQASRQKKKCPSANRKFTDRVFILENVHLRLNLLPSQSSTMITKHAQEIPHGHPASTCSSRPLSYIYRLQLAHRRIG